MNIFETWIFFRTGHFLTPSTSVLWRWPPLGLETWHQVRKLRCNMLIFKSKITSKLILIYAIFQAFLARVSEKRFPTWNLLIFCHTTTSFNSHQKPNSWMYNLVEVSGHNLESSQTWDFRIQYLHYKPVSNHFCSRRGGGSKTL